MNGGNTSNVLSGVTIEIRKEMIPQITIEYFFEKYSTTFKDTPHNTCKSFNMLVTVMLYSTMVGYLLQQAFLEFILKYHRKHTFSCHSVLKAMELNGGALNCMALEVIRRV